MNNMSEGFEFDADKLIGARESFIGKITWAVLPCNCEICRRGDERLREMGRKGGRDRLHVTMEPLTTYERDQNEWYSPSKTAKSKWGHFMARLKNLGFAPEEVRDSIGDEGHVTALEGQIFEWEEVPIEAGFGGREVNVWLPARTVEEEEAAELQEEEREIEETEFDEESIL